jgi:hypothetical protein
MRLVRMCALIGCTGVLAVAQDTSRFEESFKEKIQPIIFKSCNGCHTYGGHAGGLRMDTFAGFMKGGDRGPLLVAGDPKTSLIMKAVRREEELKMPPMRPIEDSDIALLQNFILELGGAAPVTISAAPKPATPIASAPKPAAPSSVKPTTPAPVKTAAAPAIASAQVAAKPAPEAPPSLTPEQEQFFESKVRPLLTKNCYSCHTRAATSGLRVDSRAAILTGGSRGPAAVPGNPDASLMITAVRFKTKLQMPPTGILKPEEVAVLEQWVKEGLPWPAPTATTGITKVTEEKKNFWSFRPPVKPDVPKVDTAWAVNDIDRFIAAKHREKNLKPVADADKRTLIRRLSLDLTGLPPTPDEVQAFLDDKSADAYPKLVEKTLGSRAYGERWGRKWLDVVRYGDTSGGDGDFPIPQATKYRDYVIQSFIDDKPYDRFIREQIAGDLLPYQTEPEHWNNIVATGYLAGTVRGEGKYGYVSDAVDNLGSAFLGLTVGCARCHDHKFDPLPTADYYSLYGILYSTNYAEPGAGNARYQRFFTYRDPATAEREDYKTFQSQLKPIAEAIFAVRRLPGTYDDLVPQLEARRMHLYEHFPKLGESAYAVMEGEPQNVKIQHYGDPKDLGPEVPRGFLQVLGGGPLPEGTKGSGRVELAEWLVSRNNPLTARVMVNRIWQSHFGVGLVPTANDFGTRGTPPVNQELLDYLATKFIESGWSVKAMHREILLSHAYRLSAADSGANAAIDPENSFVWRHSRVRMDAEQIRDSLLATSGLLDPTPGGEHAFPPFHEWNWEDQNQFAPVMTDYENNKRSVYMMVPRSTRLQYFNLFDGPNTNVSTEQRSASITPLQALYFMNAPFPKQAATNLAAKLAGDKAAERSNLEKAFQTIYSRPPAADEIERSRRLLRTLEDLYTAKGVQQGSPQSNAWSDLLQAMYASNEFMFIE